MTDDFDAANRLNRLVGDLSELAWLDIGEVDPLPWPRRSPEDEDG
jgi:hypothetical protein